MSTRSGIESTDKALHAQGTAWSWGLPLHRALDSQLQAAINSIHALGVRHADLHEDNILVTRDHRVLILDFASAELDPSQESLAAEQASINDMLSWQVKCFPKLINMILGGAYTP